MTLIVCSEHGKTLSQVPLMLDSRIHSLSHYVKELTGETVSEHEIATIAPHEYGHLVRTDKISCISQPVFGQLRCHGLSIFDMMFNIELKVAFERHLLKLVYFYFFVPIVPNLWERRTLFRLEKLYLIIILFTHE